MLQVCNAPPYHQFQQTTQHLQQSTQYGSDFSIDRYLQETLAPTTTMMSSLPSIDSAFMPRAHSPGAVSYETDSNMSGEPQDILMMDLQSPCPSEASAADSTIMDEEMMLINQFVIREIVDNIRPACQIINISPDPYQWSIEDVVRWIRRTQEEYCLTDVNIDYFSMPGPSLCNLTEEDFRQRAPQSGDALFTQLDIWKSAAHPSYLTQPIPEQFHQPQSPPMPPMSEILVPVPQQLPTPAFPFNIKIEPQQEDVDTASVISGSSSDEHSIPSPSQSAGSGPDTSMTPNHTGSIHLWQFLKELLLQPDSYGYCIRWLDRSQGIFKIEDSVKVATLWGRRKNRPAMNYDKMSRSIRQYYKKGIMKKTEVSQRLVYQFVTPC